MTPPQNPVTIDTPIQFNDPLPDKVDIVVIGGGVIGVFSALYLARMGQKVMICEKGRIAGEQSSRNWGWIRQHGRDRAELPIMMESLRLWHDINRETNDACGVVTAGTIYAARSRSELDAIESWLDIARECGLDSAPLSKRDLLDKFSGASTFPWTGAAWTPSDARGEPWVAVPAVARLAHESGVRIRENCAVRGLDVQAGQIHGVSTEDGFIACDQVVLAGGAWSSLFAGNHGIKFPQLAVKATVSQTAPMQELFNGCFVDEKLAIRQRTDGGLTMAVADQNEFFLGIDAFRHTRVFMPALRESWKDIDVRIAAPTGYPDGWTTRRSWSLDQPSPFEATRVLEPAPNQKYIKMAADRFAERFPKIGRPKVITSWSGMVDATPDIVPVVDRVPSLDGLIIGTGMCGHGFGIGPGFGSVIANIATGRHIEHDIRRFRFQRFSDGSPLELGPAL